MIEWTTVNASREPEPWSVAARSGICHLKKSGPALSERGGSLQEPGDPMTVDTGERCWHGVGTWATLDLPGLDTGEARRARCLEEPA